MTQGEIEQAAQGWAGLPDSERERIKRECNNGVEPMRYRVEPLAGLMYRNHQAYAVTNGGPIIAGLFVDDFSKPKNDALVRAQALCDELNAAYGLDRNQWLASRARYCLDTFGQRAA